MTRTCTTGISSSQRSRESASRATASFQEPSDCFSRPRVAGIPAARADEHEGRFRRHKPARVGLAVVVVGVGLGGDVLVRPQLPNRLAGRNPAVASGALHDPVIATDANAVLRPELQVEQLRSRPGDEPTDDLAVRPEPMSCGPSTDVTAVDEPAARLRVRALALALGQSGPDSSGSKLAQIPRGCLHQRADSGLFGEKPSNSGPVSKHSIALRLPFAEEHLWRRPRAKMFASIHRNLSSRNVPEAAT